MKKAIICFTRVPIPGKTKTRLIPLLGREHCAALHTAFLRDIASACMDVDAKLFVAHTPEDNPDPLRNIFPHDCCFFPQRGDNLGTRMDHALTSVLAHGYDACLLIGADLPLLTADHLNKAFDALTNADMTLGPTSDGGYYLIGLRKPCSAVFCGQQYSHASVFENTVSAAHTAGLTCATAPLCDDVDTPEDLKQLWHIIQNHDSHTARYLRSFIASGVIL
ncbi:MAG: TIGR04282 family arsenosugar biosynthesis glycosyltransferase [Oscillospiraceae bacterium]|nr:TIGR04282 family arsenosugar biosynthesis glycosyltransferase [Oscillospiraceae bacterium]